MPAKLLVIGYDGGTLDVIEPLVRKGLLPTFSKLIKEGVHGDLQSVYPPLSAPAWASFMTGKNPGKHSIFNFTVKGYGTYYNQPVTSGSISGLTLWEFLSMEGKKVAVINVPMTYPPRIVNGIMISGLGTPNEESEFIYPVDFAQEFRKAFPDYLIDVGWTRYGNERVDEFLEEITSLTQKTYDSAVYCLRKQFWDFFIVVFVGPDRVQHRLWKSIIFDEANVNENSDARERNRKVQNYFNKLDSLIGELIKESGDDATIFALSDHGFGPFNKDIDLNNWLASEGFLKYSSNKASNISRVLKAAKRMALNLGISKERIMKRFGGKIDVYKYLERSSATLRQIEWSETKAFCCSSHFIHINLKGRERFGIVNPGQEYEALRDEIITKLHSLRIPETDCQPIEKVQRTEEVYSGDHLGIVPDLIITKYNEEGYIGLERLFGGERDDKIFVKTAECQEGVHRRNGFFIASGKNIRKGLKIDGATILDLLPTILFMFDLAIPNDVDGKVLTSIFQGIERRPRFEAKKSVSGQPFELLNEEKAKLLETLKDLGYL